MLAFLVIQFLLFDSEFLSLDIYAPLHQVDLLFCKFHAFCISSSSLFCSCDLILCLGDLLVDLNKTRLSFFHFFLKLFSGRSLYFLHSIKGKHAEAYSEHQNERSDLL